MPDESRIPEIGLFGLMRRRWRQPLLYSALAIGVLMLLKGDRVQNKFIKPTFRRPKELEFKE